MTDSDPGRAVCSRKGFGRLKHVNIRFLWIQDAVAKKKVTLKQRHVETRAKYFQCCPPGYKAPHQERFEALSKMVDIEAPVTETQCEVFWYDHV